MSLQQNTYLLSKSASHLQFPTLCNVRYDKDEENDFTPFRLSRLGLHRSKTSISDDYYRLGFPDVLPQTSDTDDTRNHSQFAGLFSRYASGKYSNDIKFTEDDEDYVSDEEDEAFFDRSTKRLRFKVTPASANKDFRAETGDRTALSWIGDRRESCNYTALYGRTNTSSGFVSSMSKLHPQDWSFMGASHGRYSKSAKYYSDTDQTDGHIRWMDEMRRWMNVDSRNSYLSFVNTANMSERILSQNKDLHKDCQHDHDENEICERFLEHFKLMDAKQNKPLLTISKRTQRRPLKLPEKTEVTRPKLWKAPPPPKIVLKRSTKVHFKEEKPKVEREKSFESVHSIEPVTVIETMPKTPLTKEPVYVKPESPVIEIEKSPTPEQIFEFTSQESPREDSTPAESSKTPSSYSRTPSIYKSPSVKSENYSFVKETSESEDSSSPDHSQQQITPEPTSSEPSPEPEPIVEAPVAISPVPMPKKIPPPPPAEVVVHKPPDPKFVRKPIEKKTRVAPARKMAVKFEAQPAPLAVQIVPEPKEPIFEEVEPEPELPKFEMVIPDLPQLPEPTPGSRTYQELEHNMQLRPRIPKEYKGPRWGAKPKLRDLEAERERERLAEMRKKKAADMAERLRRLRASEMAGSDGPRYEEYGWLAKFCILNRANVQNFKGTFDAIDIDGKGYLNAEEVLLGLKVVNSQLTMTEEEYMFRVLEMCGYKLSHGADLKLFAVIAAISHRITSLDNWARCSINQMDFQYLEMKLFLCKSLWESNVDADSKKMSIDSLAIELMAGGVSEKHIQEVRQRLGWMLSIDLLDFLTYIPLFIMLHTSIIDNPLTTVRNK